MGLKCRGEMCFVSHGENVPDWKKTGVLNRKKKGNVLHAKKSIIQKEVLLLSLNGLLQRRTYVFLNQYISLCHLLLSLNQL